MTLRHNPTALETERWPTWALAASLAGLLSACGGGGGSPIASEEATQDAVAEITEPSDLVDDRSFALWDGQEAAAVQAEQRAQDPAADASEVVLIVRMNPAAVLGSDRATMAGAAGNGESGDAAALHASRLAAKVQAVATASQAVMARSVLLAAPQARVRQQFSHALEGFVLTVPWAQAAAVAAELARNPAVDGVEPERTVSVSQTAPARALDSRAWGVDRIDQRLRQFDGSFKQSAKGSGVNVYVMDTGVSPHQELGSRLVAGYTAVSDGRGTADCHGHGTHVAGTAAGNTLGVAPGAKVVPVRVMDCRGSGSGSQLLAGLDWVAAHGVRPGVVNLSLGGPASSTFDAGVDRLVKAGFHVVAAAGNSNADACLQSPARAAGVVAVAASDNADAKASFSNWGRCVALWAPGTAIASAGIASPTAVVSMNGTSMAAPHVAGAAALLLEAAPTLAPSVLRERLLARASANTVNGTPANMTRSLLYAGLEDGNVIAPTPTPAPTPSPTPVPSATVVSVRGVAMTTQVPAVGAWTAHAVVTVVNPAGATVAGAKVLGRYSNMTSTVSCTTGSAGTCTLSSAAASWSSTTTLGFAVTDVQGSGMAYTGGGVRNAQVSRPAAPVASVAALTGTMQRATASAVEWKPQFTATVKDKTGAAVASALVQTTMQVHAGSAVVGTQTMGCFTNSAGQCSISWVGPTLNATHTGARLAVTSVQRSYLSYQAGAVTTATVGRVQ